MGEAENRKSQDSHFEKFSKESRTRGIIVSSPLSIDLNSNFISMKGNLDPLELRFSLLYWDKLIFPKSTKVLIHGGDDCDFLIQAGVMSRPAYGKSSGVINSVEMPITLWNVFIEAFTECESKEPGVWSLAQGENSLYIKNSNGLFSDSQGVSVNLIRDIPTPADDVPLAEILEFKEKRRDELLVFHKQIDKLTEEIQNSQDNSESFKKIVNDIDVACSDLLKVGREWQYPIHISDFKASINFNGVKVVGAMGIGWHEAIPYGLVAAGSVAALAGVASMLDIKADIGFQSIQRPSSPFRYVLKAHQELV